MSDVDFKNVSPEKLLMAIIELQKRLDAAEKRIEQISINAIAERNKIIHYDQGPTATGILSAFF